MKGTFARRVAHGKKCLAFDKANEALSLPLRQCLFSFVFRVFHHGQGTKSDRTFGEVRAPVGCWLSFSLSHSAGKSADGAVGSSSYGSWPGSESNL